MQQRTAAVERAAQHRVTGSVSLTPRSIDIERVRVALIVSSTEHSGSSLRWAVLPGRCGASALPLLSYEQFPTIEVGGNGRGEVNAELLMRLDMGGTYHVNVYQSRGTQLSDVVTCANLRQ